MKNFSQANIKLLFFILLFIIGIIIYLPGLNGNFFILDDLFTIPKLPTINTWNDLWTSLQGNQTGLLKRPVSIFSLSLIKTLANDNATVFKWVNWLLHSLNALLIYWLLNQISSILKLKTKQSLILLTIVIWYCHPLLVSTVLYPIQLMTILASLFILLAINYYLHIRSHYDYFSLFHSTMLFTVMALALLSKEIGALLPLHFLLLEKFVLNKTISDNKNTSYEWLFIYIPLGIGFLAFIFILPTVISEYDLRDFTLLERLGLESLVLVHYIKQILTPNLADLSLFQDYWKTEQLELFKLASSIFILLFLMFIAWFYRIKKSIISYGIFFFFISHLLESSILPLEIAFEHRNYLASFGIIILLLSIVTSSKVSPYLAKFIIVLYTGLLIVLTTLRVQEWQNENSFYFWAYQKNNGSTRAAEGYAQTLIKLGQVSEGIKLFERIKSTTNNGAYDIKIANLTCSFPLQTSIQHLDKDNIHNNKYDKYLSQVLLELFENTYIGKCHLPYPFLIDYHNTLLLHPQLIQQENNVKLIKLVLGRYYWLNAQKQQSIKSYQSSLSMGNVSAGLELLSIHQLGKNDKNFRETMLYLNRLKPQMEKKEQRLFEQLKQHSYK